MLSESLIAVFIDVVLVLLNQAVAIGQACAFGDLAVDFGDFAVFQLVLAVLLFDFFIAFFNLFVLFRNLFVGLLGNWFRCLNSRRNGRFDVVCADVDHAGTLRLQTVWRIGIAVARRAFPSVNLGRAGQGGGREKGCCQTGFEYGRFHGFPLCK